MITEMKVSNTYPPNYQDIVSILGEDINAVYCYGDTIYNPNSREITPDVEIHEQVHSRQQGDNPELWYNKYLTSGEFRLSQEIEAYGTQYEFMKPFLSAKLKKWLKEKLAEALSSETYGNIITFQEAEQAIRNFNK